jgi:hypothetical protein
VRFSTFAVFARLVEIPMTQPKRRFMGGWQQ